MSVDKYRITEDGNLVSEIGMRVGGLDYVALFPVRSEDSQPCEYSKAVSDCLDKGLSTANVHSELSCPKAKTFQHGLCRDCLNDRFNKSGIRGILR